MEIVLLHIGDPRRGQLWQAGPDRPGGAGTTDPARGARAIAGNIALHPAGEPMDGVVPRDRGY